MEYSISNVTHGSLISKNSYQLVYAEEDFEYAGWDVGVSTSLTFKGWYTDETYETTWNFTTDTVTGNMTLYATGSTMLELKSFSPSGWDYASDMSYEVIYGKPIGQVPDSVLQTSIPYMGYILDSDGYTYNGWCIYNPYSGVKHRESIDENTIYDGSYYMIQTDWVLSVPNTYTLRYYYSNGKAPADALNDYKVVTVGEPVGTLQIPTREGYIFTSLWINDS